MSKQINTSVAACLVVCLNLAYPRPGQHSPKGANSTYRRTNWFRSASEPELGIVDVIPRDGIRYAILFALPCFFALPQRPAATSFVRPPFRSALYKCRINPCTGYSYYVVNRMPTVREHLPNPSIPKSWYEHHIVPAGYLTLPA